MAKVTLREIAKAAGVSEMTVSRVFRGEGPVADATRERVLAISEAFGYVPNQIAGALASKHANLVGVAIPSLSSTVFSTVLTGIVEALKETPLQPAFGITHYQPEQEEQVIRNMLSWRPSGLIVTGLEHSDAARAMMQNADIPIAEIMDVDGEPLDINVGISHHGAGAAMAEAIIARGYRHIGFIGTKLPYDFRAAKRLKGFQQALNKAGFDVEITELYSGPSTLKKGRELTAMILSTHPHLDCIYYSSDLMAAGGLMHCFAQNIPIPDQLALAGFNGLDFLDGLPQRIATMDAHRYEIGYQAAKLILENPQDTSKRRIVLEPTLDVGDTL